MRTSQRYYFATFSCILALFIAKASCFYGGKDTLGVNESLQLHHGHFLESSNQRYRFLRDSSSFLVIQFVYFNHSINIWVANTGPIPSRRILNVTMHEKGRLEAYAGGLDVAAFVLNAEQKVMISNTRATLLDNGNLVLRSPRGRVLWQSFDHPSNIWLSDTNFGIFVLDTKSSTNCCLVPASTSSAAGSSLAPAPAPAPAPASAPAPAPAPAPGRFRPSFPPPHSMASAPGPSVPGRKKSNLLPVIVPVATFLAAVTLLFLCCKVRKKNGCFRAVRRLMSSEKQQLGDKGDDGSLFFCFVTIEIATDNFSEENKLGQGGFGPVYMGKLDNGLEIAVKRLNRMSGHGIEQFKNEVTVISKLQHRNLVRLLGYCIHREERLLIYEYLPNKSLDSILFDPAKKDILDWTRRLRIIEGIAQGLLYLHKYSRLKIIHRDLKTSNVLLDNDLNPKISDFGTARIFSDDEMRANTNNIVGTYGYMSPEYAMDGIFSEKSDVFSFGVMILEIISGRKNNSFHVSDRHLNLIGHVWDLWIEGRILEITDSCLGETVSKLEALQYVEVGLLCVQENAADRPIMSDVVSMLLNESKILANPKRPAFSEIMSLNNSMLLPENPEHCSVNRVTISDVEGR
ncbi:hypothetical protein ACH5RR_025150 [Cinchona calisaya]|uniref:non-specific serine/threonine protein kinase n=1 Tax=Cinchona calisaya TaxID=153742 RepID=A0ABD2Z3U8_9GENT